MLDFDIDPSLRILPTEYMPVLETTTSDDLIIDTEIKGPAERGLLAAILEMAYRDLSEEAKYLDRKSAIAWFTNEHVKGDGGFSFSEIKEYLDLGVLELLTISVKLKQAEKFEAKRISSIIQQQLELQHQCFIAA